MHTCMYIQVTCNIVSCISCSTQHVRTVRVTLLGLCGCVCVWVCVGVGVGVWVWVCGGWGGGRVSVCLYLSHTI